MDEIDYEEPAEIDEITSAATLNSLPLKSRELYNGAYKKFIEWCKQKKIKKYTMC